MSAACSICKSEAPFDKGVFWTRPQNPDEWHWTHPQCIGTTETLYAIAGNNLDTAEKALEWRRRLLELPWLRLGALDRGLQSLHRCLEGGCC
ncbi:MAG TPA: hypothetical protein VGO93_15965 [Candidatus Xenobia bacterium]|jgi:hypothetical protein